MKRHSIIQLLVSAFLCFIMGAGICAEPVMAKETETEPESMFSDLGELIAGWLGIFGTDNSSKKDPVFLSDDSGLSLQPSQDHSPLPDQPGSDSSFSPDAPDIEDSAREGTVTIALEPAYTADSANLLSLEGVKFGLARVAAIENGKYVLLDAYKDTGVDLSSLATADSLQKAAALLEEAVLKDTPDSVRTAVTDAQGRASISNVGAGVYLLYAIDTASYELISPTLISMPSYSEQSADMAWQIDVQPKHSPLPVLKITKVDPDGNIIVSSKTEIGIYSDPECKKPVLESKTDQQASVSMALTYGTYYVQETAAPDGYALNHNVFVVDFDSYQIMVDGKKVEPDENNTIYLEIEDEKTSHFTGEDSENSTTPGNTYRPPVSSSTSTTRPPTGVGTHASLYLITAAVALGTAGALIAVSKKKHHQQ